jgi:hypothetical protein
VWQPIDTAPESKEWDGCLVTNGLDVTLAFWRWRSEEWFYTNGAGEWFKLEPQPNYWLDETALLKAFPVPVARAES